MAFLKPGLLALAISSALLAGCLEKQSASDVYENSSVEVTAIEIPDHGAAKTPVLNLTGRAGLSDHEVRSPREGTIKLVKVAEGQAVKKGDLLFTLDDTELKASLALSEQSYQLARQQYRSIVKVDGSLKSTVVEDGPAKKLLDEASALSQKAHREYVDALVSRNIDFSAVRQAKIRAQVDGVVGRMSIKPGDKTTPGALLAVVTPAKNQWVELEMSTAAFDAIKGDKLAGPTATLTLLDGSTALAQLQEPVLLDGSRVLVRLVLLTPSTSFIAGDDVPVEIKGRPLEGLVNVPAQALKSNADGPYVFVVSKFNRAELRQVKVVQWDSGSSFVRSGLLPGDRIVTSNFTKIRVGSRAKVTKLEGY